jgi:hypothetical protein
MVVFKKGEADKQATKVAGVRPAARVAQGARTISGTRSNALHDSCSTPRAHAATRPQTYRDVALTGAIIFTLFAVLRVA